MRSRRSRCTARSIRASSIRARRRRRSRRPPTTTGTCSAIKDGGIYGSFWGIKGTEDIGGGYKVNFKLQGVFNSSNGKLGLADTTGGTAVFNQQTTVGLSGPFGTFDAGRQFTPMIYAMADTDVRAAQYFGSILAPGSD